jgi:hypothetical protein
VHAEPLKIEGTLYYPLSIKEFSKINVSGDRLGKEVVIFAGVLGIT